MTDSPVKQFDQVRNLTTFWKSMFRYPLQTGAVAPSSRYLAEKMIDRLHLEKARCVVELGPGTGAFTRHIVAKLHPDATFFAIERNPEMVTFLNRTMPGVNVVCDGAENLRAHLGDMPADYIVCGLPLSWLPRQVGDQVLDAAHAALRPGGGFAMFQYIHAALTPLGAHVEHMLRRRFRSIHIGRTLRNIPPALVYTCER